MRSLADTFRVRETGGNIEFDNALDRLGDTTERIGGSNAQRALITLTREATAP